ncbi:putative oxidoreductase dhs-27 [Aphelenchoides besseyi]|nr:putative oxidoreductase dhs-27 [Aphelenchoides besseyi]
MNMWDTVKEFVRNRKRVCQRSGKLVEMTKSQEVDSLVTSSVDLDEEICGSGVSNRRFLDLLIRNCEKFEKIRGTTKINQISYDNCGKGNGYLSLVIKVHVHFESANKTPFSVVLKVPMPDAMKGMIENGQEKEEKEDEPEIDENARTIIDGHNRECQFYERFGSSKLGDLPMPEVYYTQQFPDGPSVVGNHALILMENLSDRCEILGIARAVNSAQIYSMSRVLAQLQFRVHQMDEHRNWWMSMESNLHLDAFYSSWMPCGLPWASSFEGIAPMMRKLKTICNPAFGQFALRSRPKEYDAIAFCHGDIQMYNILYEKLPDGEISDKLIAIIDWQIILYGNPCFDLARFLVFCADEVGHREADIKAYGIYYGELTRLYTKAGKEVPFTFEQGFELFELAFAHQTTYLTSFLFFFSEMAKQSEIVKQNLKQMGERARYCIEQTIDKIPNRSIHGPSEKQHGVVLNGQDFSGRYLHYVYCFERSHVYPMTEEVFKRTVRAVERKRRNDVHRKIDETLKFGDYIYFCFDHNNEVVDYERGTNAEDAFVVDNRAVFKSRCVFNPELDRVHTEHFEELKIPKGLLKTLGEIPTPNVEIFCYLGFEISPDLRLRAELVKILEVNGEDQSFVMKASWAKHKNIRADDPYASDNDVQLEDDLVANVGALTGKVAFITGLTSVYLVDQPTVMAILPKYNLKNQEIGREAKVDLIYNDVLNSYVVFAMELRRSHYYLTRYVQLPNDDIKAHFYLDLYAGEVRYGFYKVRHLGYVADPQGYLDIAYMFNTDHMPHLKSGRFTVPVIDRLGQRHETQPMSEFNLVTRFEIANAGDCVKQRRVLNEEIKTHKDLNLPNFIVIEHIALPMNSRLYYQDKFRFRAAYEPEINCYVSPIFGFVPSADEYPPEKPNILTDKFPYLITATRNSRPGAQTPLHQGRVVPLKL